MYYVVKLLPWRQAGVHRKKGKAKHKLNPGQKLGCHLKTTG